jgi:hypothetical protein
MRHRPKSTDALHIALGGLPNKTRVEADPDIEVSAKTVGDLCKVTVWPRNLNLTGTRPESPSKGEQSQPATRISPRQ